MGWKDADTFFRDLERRKRERERAKAARKVVIRAEPEPEPYKHPGVPRSEWLTARQAAEVTGYDYAYLGRLLAGGRVRGAEKMRGIWRIPPNGISELKRRREAWLGIESAEVEGGEDGCQGSFCQAEE